MRELRLPEPGADGDPGVPRCGHCHQPLPWIADANDDTFAEIAEGASIPVVVDMWPPCRMVSPALEQVATELAGRIKLVWPSRR
jgi:thioredoxin 2